MITHDAKIVEYKALSKLSGKIYYITTPNGVYGCFNGLVLPYNIAVSVILWAMSNSAVYHKQVKQYVSVIKDLNKDNTEIYTMDDWSSESIAWYLVSKLRSSSGLINKDILDELRPRFE